MTTSIQTLSEKVKDSAGSIKDRITETTTETGKEMVNGIETTYKQVETKVNGVVTKTTKTYDDMSKTLAATLTRTTSKVEGGVTTAIQEVTKKYADGSEHIEKTETITEENIVDGVAQTTKTINTYIDGVLQNTKVDTEEAEKSIQAALSRTEKYISEIQGSLTKAFSLVKSLFTDIKNKDGKAIAGDVVKVIFGQVTQEQRNTILKWADDAMTAINEHYAQGGIQGALQSIADLFSNGITLAVNGSTKEVQSFAAAMKGLSGTGGSGGIVSSILKLFGGGTKAAAAAGEAGAGQAIASAAGGAAPSSRSALLCWPSSAEALWASRWARTPAARRGFWRRALFGKQASLRRASGGHRPYRLDQLFLRQKVWQKVLVFACCGRKRLVWCHELSGHSRRLLVRQRAGFCGLRLPQRPLYLQPQQQFRPQISGRDTSPACKAEHRSGAVSARRGKSADRVG